MSYVKLIKFRSKFIVFYERTVWNLLYSMDVDEEHITFIEYLLIRVKKSKEHCNDSK